jgi:hypothetical protein
MLGLTAERFDQMLRAFQGKAYQVNHNIGAQRADTFPKSTATFLLGAIKLEPRHKLPGTMWSVGLAFAPADREDLVPGSDQSRDQVRSYMSGTTNDDDTHFDLSFFADTTGARIREVKNSGVQQTNAHGRHRNLSVPLRAFSCVLDPC